jgi:hypothetical protein
MNDDTCTDCGTAQQWRFCCSSYCHRCCNKAHHYSCSDVTMSIEMLHLLLGDKGAETLIKICGVRR